MTDFARFLIDLLTTLWPLRQVNPGCKGVRLWRNHPVAELGPGIYVVLPYFGEIIEVSVVPAVITTPLSTITLLDGATLAYSLSATLQVVDPTKATCEIEDYRETAQELITAVPAEVLATLPAEKVDPDNRARLLGTLKRRVNAELADYGIEVRELRFTNFASNLRTYRFLTDSSGLSSGW